MRSEEEKERIKQRFEGVLPIFIMQVEINSTSDFYLLQETSNTSQIHSLSSPLPLTLQIHTEGDKSRDQAIFVRPRRTKVIRTGGTARDSTSQRSANKAEWRRQAKRRGGVARTYQVYNRRGRYVTREDHERGGKLYKEENR